MTTEAEFKRLEENWERKWEEEYEAYCDEQDDDEEDDTEEYDGYDADVDKYLDKECL